MIELVHNPVYRKKTNEELYESNIRSDFTTKTLVSCKNYWTSHNKPLTINDVKQLLMMENRSTEDIILYFFELYDDKLQIVRETPSKIVGNYVLDKLDITYPKRSLPYLRKI